MVRFRRSLLRSAQALATVSLLALSGALALPATAQDDLLLSAPEETERVCPLPPGPSTPTCDGGYEGGVILVGGTSASEGSVRICHNNEFRSVCDDFFYHRQSAAAGVVCRQLGYATGVPTQRSRFVGGDGPVNYWLDDLVCKGAEATLGDCGNAGWGLHNCDASERAGAICTTRVTGLRATGGKRQVSLAWDAPGSQFDRGITDHEYRYKTLSEDGYGTWRAIPDSAAMEANVASYTVTGLFEGTWYTFQVRILGGGNASDPGTAGVRTAGEANRLPEFAGPQKRSVAENSAAGTAVGTPVTATDADGEPLRYSLEAVDDHASFTIEPSSGQIRTRAVHDHEARSRYSVTVKADDGEGGTGTVAVTIEIADVEERPTDAEIVTGPGPDGVWNAGERVEARVRFGVPVRVVAPAGGRGPDLLLAFYGGGGRASSFGRAVYTGGSGTDTLSFAYTVTPADTGAVSVVVPRNALRSRDASIEPSSAARALQAWFVSPPARHDGEKRIKVRVAFSEAPANVGEHGVEVEGGEVTSVRPVVGNGNAPGGAGTRKGTRSAGGRNAGQEDREVVWEFEIEPDSDGDVTVTLDAERPCDEPGAICTADGRSLSEDISTTVEGPDEGPPALTASFEAMPETHDGESAFRFRVAFSEDIRISFRSLREDAFTVTGGRVTRGRRVDDRRDLFEMTVEPDGEGDVTVTLPAGRECTVSGAICTKGENRRQLTNAPTATVAGPAMETGPAPLTASFVGVPAEHDGESGFRFRVAFSEDIGISFRSLREDAFTVTGGRVTRGRRVDDRRDLFEMTVEPDSNEAVTISLPAGRACGVSGAICTKGENRRQLTNTPTATVAGPAAAPLTASFEGVPAAHDGETAFTLRLAFSEPLSWMNGRRLREDVVAVAGGRATSASRVNRRRDLWQLTVEPDSLADVTVTLAAGAACRTPAAVCTKDGRALSNTLSTTVRGPVSVSVADARAEEGTDESIDFAVTLSRAASGTVAVAYATADGSATAGADYTARKGQLTFAPGETEKTVRVPMLDDAIDEGAETFTLRLTNAAGAVIADGTATGTLENADPLQKMWLARFGRTVAGQVTEVIGARLTGSAGGGSHVTIGGRQLSLGGGSKDSEDTAARTDRIDRLGGAGGAAADTGPWGGLMDEGHGADGARSLTAREVLLGSAFQLSLGAAEDDGVAGPAMRWRAWGRVTGTGFNGTNENRGVPVTLDGHVVTGALGVDAEWARWLAGVALSHSIGDGSFGLSGHADAGCELESTLTGVYPYARYALHERLSLWGVLGHAWGDLTLSEDRTGTSIETDTILRMGAVGARGVLLPAPTTGGFELAVRTDALLVQMTSDAVTGGADSGGNLAAAAADTSRLRLMVEGSQTFALAWGGLMTPSLEVGLRHDGGDAETGTGVEVGGGLRYTDPARGLTVEARARVLVAHEDGGYEEWGASGAVRLDPGASGRGLFLTLSPTYGAAASGVEGLWSRQDTAGLAAGDAFEAGRRLEAELGYGLGAFGGSGVATPYAGLGLSDGGQTWRMGTRWTLGPDFELGVEGTRRAVANGEAPEHGLMLRGSLRW